MKKLTTYVFESRLETLDETLDYHINEGFSLANSVLMTGSDKYHEFINFAREKHSNGEISVNESDRFILENLRTGEKAMWKPRGGKPQEVVLHSPERGNLAGRKFYVFVPTDKKDEESGLPLARILGFGDPNATIKNEDPARSKSFLARHKCSTKKDTNTAGFWSCNVHMYWKALGLKSDNPW